MRCGEVMSVLSVYAMCVCVWGGRADKVSYRHSIPCR